MKSDDILAVYLTFMDVEQADQIGRVLLGEKLIACINILPGVTSLFEWHGEVQQASEVIAIAKTTRGAFDRLAARVQDLHSYEVPCVIAYPADTGLPAFMAWVAQSVR